MFLVFVSLASDLVSSGTALRLHVRSDSCLRRGRGNRDSAVELAGFFLLNLGLPVLDSLPAFQKFADGLFQSLSVRASGFGILPVAQFAPALL
jgi:hypothetical protein